jgi:hypothetical protein
LQWATFAVALGPAEENGLAHLGLSARSAKIGEGRPWSPGAVATDSGDPAAQDRGEKVREYHDVVVSRFGVLREGRGSWVGFATAAVD